MLKKVKYKTLFAKLFGPIKKLLKHVFMTIKTVRTILHLCVKMSYVWCWTTVINSHPSPVCKLLLNILHSVSRQFPNYNCAHSRPTFCKAVEIRKYKKSQKTTDLLDTFCLAQTRTSLKRKMCRILREVPTCSTTRPLSTR